MTEEEAKQKWCPFARDAESNAAGYTTTNTTAKCIGSECMAWREKHPRMQREDHSGARDVMIAEAVKTGRTMQRNGPAGSLGILYLDAVGYCGLAGKP